MWAHSKVMGAPFCVGTHCQSGSAIWSWVCYEYSIYFCLALTSANLFDCSLESFWVITVTIQLYWCNMKIRHSTECMLLYNVVEIFLFAILKLPQSKYMGYFVSWLLNPLTGCKKIYTPVSFKDLHEVTLSPDLEMPFYIHHPPKHSCKPRTHTHSRSTLWGQCPWHEEGQSRPLSSLLL